MSWKGLYEKLMTTVGKGDCSKEDVARAIKAAQGAPTELDYERGEVGRFECPLQTINDIQISPTGKIAVAGRRDSGGNSTVVLLGTLFDPTSWKEVFGERDEGWIERMEFDALGNLTLLFWVIAEKGESLRLRYGAGEAVIANRDGGEFEEEELREFSRRLEDSPLVHWRAEGVESFVLPCPPSDERMDWHAIHVKIASGGQLMSMDRTPDGVEVCCIGHFYNKPLWLMGTRYRSSVGRLRWGSRITDEVHQPILPSIRVHHDGEMTFLEHRMDDGIPEILRWRYWGIPAATEVVARGDTFQFAMLKATRMGERDIVVEEEFQGGNVSRWRLVSPGSDWATDWYEDCVVRELFVFGNTHLVAYTERGGDERLDNELMIFDRDGQRHDFEQWLTVRVALHDVNNAIRPAKCHNRLAFEHWDARGTLLFVIDPTADGREINRQITQGGLCGNVEKKDVVYAGRFGYVTVRHIGYGTLSVRRFGH